MKDLPLSFYSGGVLKAHADDVRFLLVSPDSSLFPSAKKKRLYNLEYNNGPLTLCTAGRQNTHLESWDTPEERTPLYYLQMATPYSRHRETTQS